MTKWEYKSMAVPATGLLTGGDVDLERLLADLNQLGAEGWELVNVFGTNMHEGATREVIAVLKRQRGS